MLIGAARWRVFRYLATLVGAMLGLCYAVIGSKALFLSPGRLPDLVTILSIFFITLPGAVVGAFAPRIGGWTIVAAGLLAATLISNLEPEALGQVLVVYIGPSILVGLALVIAESRERRRVGAAA